jgi:DNA polymerase-1
MKTAAIDIETTGLNPRKDKILSIAIVTKDKEIVLDTSKFSVKQMTTMIQRLSEYDVVVAHNAKFDASFIYYSYGVLLRNLYCTMIGSQVINNGHDITDTYNGGHSLVVCLERFLDIKPIDSNHKKYMRWCYMNHTPGTNINEEMEEYVLEDTRYLIPMYEEQQNRIMILEMEDVIKEEMDLLPALIKMELGGCLIDTERWKKMVAYYQSKRDGMVEKLDEELQKVAESIAALQGGIYTRRRSTEVVYQGDLFSAAEAVISSGRGCINYSSSAQIIELIRRAEDVEMEAVGVDDIKTYLNEHTDTKLAKFLELLLEYRDYEKMVTTYGKKFLDKLDENNYIHTEYKQTFTKTGRLASRNPNLQNIPNGTIREFFIAREGHKMITCDMSGAEVSIAADFSKEPLLMDAILHGADMHSKLASVSFSIIFGRKVEINNTSEILKAGAYEFKKKDLRKAHKSVTFAKFYKAGAGRIYQTLASYINKYHQPEAREGIAKRISKALDKEMPALTKYLSAKIKQAQKEGYLRGAYGRIRWFDSEVYGEAANFPIQNANAEAMKMALIMIEKELDKLGYGRLVMNIHDEVVVECPDEHADTLADKICDIMAESLSYFLTDIKGGASVNGKQHWEK